VAHRADAVTAGGDDPVRGLAALPDSADLSGPTRAVVVTGRPVSALLTLGERLTLTGRDPRDFLKRVQLEHPADFWVNLALGDALLWPSPGEAGIYYRAALAARPEAAVGYCAVADALLGQKRPDEAITYYRKALAIDPKFARGESNFGRALRLLGRYDEAFTCDLNALQIDPNFAWAHYDMARSFADGGRLEEAVDHYRVIVAATPLSPEVQADYRSAMLRLGRGEQAWAEWRDGLASGALCGYDAWNGYAELSLYLGHADEYRRARATLLARFVDRPQPQVAEPVARTCLLVPDPDSPGRRQAVALADWSEAAQRGKPYHAFAAFAQGLAAFRTGNDGRAMSIMRGRAAKVLGPCPGLVTAMALMREGRGTEARATLATAVLSFDWRPERADRRDLWMYHVLRREAEAKVLPNLPAFLAGQYRPTDNDERLALLGLCQANGRWADYAALYADAVAADPAVVETAPQDVRRWAAGAAAMAAGDGATPTATRWRALGVQWMQAELDLRMGRAATVDPAGRGTLRRALGTWLTDPDLAPLRDPAALARMPEAERSQCANLWAAVRAAIDLLGQPA
jgi:tetratricopeptide (TPR) repeat protein